MVPCSVCNQQHHNYGERNYGEPPGIVRMEAQCGWRHGATVHILAATLQTSPRDKSLRPQFAHLPTLSRIQVLYYVTIYVLVVISMWDEWRLSWRWSTRMIDRMLETSPDGRLLCPALRRMYHK